MPFRLNFGNYHIGNNWPRALFRSLLSPSICQKLLKLHENERNWRPRRPTPFDPPHPLWSKTKFHAIKIYIDYYTITERKWLVFLGIKILIIIMYVVSLDNPCINQTPERASFCHPFVVPCCSVFCAHILVFSHAGNMWDSYCVLMSVYRKSCRCRI